jgi:hypothetical protein
LVRRRVDDIAAVRTLAALAAKHVTKPLGLTVPPALLARPTRSSNAAATALFLVAARPEMAQYRYKSTMLTGLRAGSI